jgi:glyoxylase-like metal-dependent hydrolase (beta-lactamase superfamily II)
MRIALAVLTAALLLGSPAASPAQDARATVLAAVAAAMGADSLKSIEYSGHGVHFAFGQSAGAGQPWPRLDLQSFTRSVNYDTTSLRDELVRTQGDNPVRGGGGQPIRGEQRQAFHLSGEHAWNVVGTAAVPTPISLVERQMQLWATPHGVVRAALANQATVQDRVLAFTVPGRLTVRAVMNEQRLIERVEAVIPHPVLGDTPVEITYREYRDFGGVKFPTRIRQSAGGHPTLDITVTDVKPNAAVDIQTPEPVRNAATGFYGKVATQMVADGVWYLTGGSHHSVVIEMRDHLVVVEAPLNEERALAVLAEARTLAPDKPVRYVVASHHHFDHAGGLRTFAGEGITVLAHDSAKGYLERVLAAPATVRPDHMAKSGRKPVVEGVGARRVLTDATRTIELHHIAGNAHADSLLMVYLPKEKLLSQADVFNPPPQGTPPPMPPSPGTVNVVENLKRLNLAVDRVLPLHGYIFPIADLHRAAGHSH